MKIRVVAPYFGRLPAYFQLFLRSCAANPLIDWLILTNRVPQVQSPANVTFLETTLADVRNRVREAIGFEPCLLSPHKLCDFRPAYGLVFSDYLKGYDFWGHCDLDMMFGSLACFVTDELLERYDRLFSRGAFIQRRSLPAPMFDPAAVSGWFITPGGFVAEEEFPELTPETIRKLNPRRPWRAPLYLWDRLRRRIARYRNEHPLWP